jgi:hypothetical protein
MNQAKRPGWLTLSGVFYFSHRAPENEILAAFLARRWAVPIATTRMIAAGAAGNVRAAMADLEMWLG